MTKVSAALAALVAITACNMPTGAKAQSYSCKAATETAERVICKNERLRNLDERMSQIYRDLMQALTREDQREGLRDYQVNFLNTRDACGRNVSCIKGAYLDQIDVLKARLRYADNGWHQ